MKSLETKEFLLRLAAIVLVGEALVTRVQAEPQDPVARAVEQVTQVHQTVLETTTPRTGSCDPASLDSREKPGKSLVQAGRKVLATLYQDCSVAKYQLTDQVSWHEMDRFSFPRNPESESGRYYSAEKLKEYRGVNPMLQMLSERKDYPNRSNGCSSAFEMPPVYSRSAQPRLSIQRSEMQSQSSEKFLNIRSDLSSSDRCSDHGASCDSRPVSGFDCTGFISAAFSAAGYRFDSDEFTDRRRGFRASDPQPMGSPWLAERANSKTGCLEHVSFSPGAGAKSLEAGDLVLESGAVVVDPGNHAIMIDSVGKDPLGLRKALSKSPPTCDISLSDFDFTYIHSGSYPADMGVSRVHSSFSAKYDSNSTLMVYLVELARHLCRNAGTSGKISSANVKTKVPVSLLRLRSDAESRGCRIPENERRKILPEQEECVRSCNFDF